MYMLWIQRRDKDEAIGKGRTGSAGFDDGMRRREKEWRGRREGGGSTDVIFLQSSAAAERRIESEVSSERYTSRVRSDACRLTRCVSLDGSEILRPLRDLEWDIALLDAGFTVHGNQTRPVGRVLEGPGGSSDVGGSGGRGVGSSQRARDGGDDSRKHGWEERRNGVGGTCRKGCSKRKTDSIYPFLLQTSTSFRREALSVLSPMMDTEDNLTSLTLNKEGISFSLVRGRRDS